MLFKGSLSNSDINEAMHVLEREFERSAVSSKTATSSRLAIEEMLLLYRDRLGEDTTVEILSRRSAKRLELKLVIIGDPYNPFKEQGSLLDVYLSPIALNPHWSYENKHNVIQFRYHAYRTTVKSILFSWNYIKKDKKLLFLAAGYQLLSGLFAVAAPIVSAQIIQAYVRNTGWQVVYIAGLLLLISLTRNLFLVLGNQTYNRLYTRTLSALEEDLVDVMLRIENSCLDDKGSGLFIQRLTTDTERIASGFNTLADMITQVINYVGILIAMFVVDRRVCLVVIILIAIQSVIEYWRTRRLEADDRVFRNAKERYSGLVGELVRGQKDVKLLNSEKQFSTELNNRITDSNEKRLYMQSRSWNLKLMRFEIGEVGSFCMIMLLGYLIAVKAVMPANALVLYNYYSSLGPNAVKFIGTLLDFIADFNLSNERVSALLNDKSFPKEKFGTVELPDMKGDITFDHVYFSYTQSPFNLSEQYVLKDLCLHIRAGESAALVGKSGCGKTTLFNLINKLYTAQKGQVLLDSVNICDLTKDSIRGNITVVSQNPYIFHMSVKDNLLLVKPDATDEQLQDVCRLACIHDDITNMPEGYDTLLGEGGINISGGQRQRLAIARAMLRDSKIILFDEATSALDNLTQSKIQTAIENMQKGRTVILIAHRLSTVINSDKILYMQDGKILAEGTHSQLLETCEPYRVLASMEGSTAGSITQ